MAPKVLIKRLGILRVAVVDQEPDVDVFLVCTDAGVTGLLMHPLVGGISVLGDRNTFRLPPQPSSAADVRPGRG